MNDTIALMKHTCGQGPVARLKKLGYICARDNFINPSMKTFLTKSSHYLDLIFYLVFMPLLVFLGPAHHWIIEWPLFFVLDCVLLCGCYIYIRRAGFATMFISRRYARIALILLTMTVCNYALTFWPHPSIDFVIPSMTEYQTSVRNYSVALSLWLMFFAVLCYALTISFITELYNQQLLRKDIEIQRDKAELATFKAQISPHFLFNTLNSLYSLVIGTSQQAEDAFIKFTELLKYTYVTTGKETVPLSDEIAYIQNYIDLQAIRLNRHTVIDWAHTVDRPDANVPPMIFLTLVENAFKYGTSTSRDCRIIIRLELKHNKLHFYTRNSIMKHPDEFRTEVPVGISNTRARLAVLFGNRFTLSTHEKEGIYYVDLNINNLNIEK